MGNPFFDATTVHAAGEDLYTAQLDGSWNLQPLPQGGIVTAIALRAMADRLADPVQRVRTLHTAYLSQVAHGPLEISVELLRRGRSMSHLRAEVRNAGSARGHVTTAVFGASRKGFDFTDLAAPVVPPPAECRSFRAPVPAGAVPFPPTPFWDERIEGRTAIGHAPWDDYVPDRAEHATWYRFDDPPFRGDGTLDPLGLVVYADTMPGAVGEKVGHTGEPWFAPSIDLTVHLLDDCHSDWILAHNQARFAGDGYASADMALWDCGSEGASAPRLVAYATQLFLFSF